ARMAFATIAVVLGARLDEGPWPVVGAVTAATALTLVFGEVVPRTLTLRHLEATGQALGGPGRAIVRTLHPLTRLLLAVGRVLVPRRHEVSSPHASDEELRQFEADEPPQDDEIEPEERAMIRSIFELADTI